MISTIRVTATITKFHIFSQSSDECVLSTLCHLELFCILSAITDLDETVLDLKILVPPSGSAGNQTRFSNPVTDHVTCILLTISLV